MFTQREHETAKSEHTKPASELQISLGLCLPGENVSIVEGRL